MYLTSNMCIIGRNLSIAVLFFLFACNNNTSLTSNEVKKDTVALTRLGESAYYLNLPANFKIEEARGKEGQLGYNIIPTDTSSTMHGFIEIEAGHRITNDTTGAAKLKDYNSSVFLNKQITWKIITIEETGYHLVTTPPGDVSASASSNKTNEIDSLIAIISTLTKK